jgi:GcrA cell cycle regulator
MWYHFDSVPKGNGMTQANWTDERVEQLKSLWTEGLSASQIARAMGGVTRNAVIGKVHRLGLAGRVAPAPNEHAHIQPPPRIAPRAQTTPPSQTEEEPVALDDGNFATVLTISDHMCRWPIGDPSDGEFHFCGRKVKPGSPYCEAHARKAYQPQQPVRRTERDKDKMTG